MITLHVHTNWPKSWKPKMIHGYDANCIAYTLGMSWLGLCVTLGKLWDRNGCKHIGSIKRFIWFH